VTTHQQPTKKMNRPERTDKECRRQGMRDVPVANYSKMQDKYIDHLESKVKALSTPVVRKSLPTDDCLEQWWAEGQDEKESFWQEAPYRTNGDVVEEIKTALKYFIETWQR